MGWIRCADSWCTKAHGHPQSRKRVAWVRRQFVGEGVPPAELLLSAMECPRCSQHFHEQWERTGGTFDEKERTHYEVSECVCPACHQFILRLESWKDVNTVARGLGATPRQFRVFHPASTQRRIPPEVPDPYATDVKEAAAVLSISPRASAALSRATLQAILRDKHAVYNKSLEKEVADFCAKANPPPGLRESIDAIRNIGNFAAHPIKDTNTGAVIAVEPEEAEWLLEVLDQLLDFTFVQPAKDAARKAALNAKLTAAGKKPMP
jgi:hypothetical protein